jgi:serine/threonine-protein kinase
MIGETCGNYRIVSRLGSGAMGTVFLAEHSRIERRAAIKVLSRELAGSPELLRRFFNEARATSSIRHPGIVEVLDCGVHESGQPYIVMEYLEGQTLEAQLARAGRARWDRASATAARIAAALAAAHRRGIIHRDVKPANVFLVADAGPEAAVKVLDFGVAKLLSDSQSTLRTHPGKLLGTPEYMAPEQCGGEGAIDERTDVYALGCLLYEMVCGRPPFSGEKISDLIVAHRSVLPPAASAEVPGLPTELDELIGSMLSKRPAERPRTMDEVAQALRRLAEYAAAELSPRTTLARPAPPRPGSPLRWAALGVISAALAALVLVYGVHRSRGAAVAPPSPPPLAPPSPASLPSRGPSAPAPPPARAAADLEPDPARSQPVLAPAPAAAAAGVGDGLLRGRPGRFDRGPAGPRFRPPGAPAPARPARPPEVDVDGIVRL